jgi:uncharacterized protein
MIHRARFSGLDVRAKKKRLVLSGHAAVFGEPSEPFPWGRQLIAPGAFSGSLRQDDVRCLWNHNSNIVLGRTRSGTLELAEDVMGLAFELRVPDTQLVRDMVVAPIERGDVQGCSFACDVLEKRWHTRGGIDYQTLTAVRLIEISPVTFPAFPQTDVSLNARTHEGLAALDLRRRRLELLEFELNGCFEN